MIPARPRWRYSYNALVRRIRPAVAAVLALAMISFGLVLILFRNSGSFLVVDNRERSEAIVITQADSLDMGYWMGLRLLAEGYGRELLLDARTDRMFFGRSQAEWAGDFIEKTAASLSRQVNVCPITAETTAQEVYEVGNCLRGRLVRSVLLVVDDFHCRRSLAIFSHLLPRYRWSIAAVPDGERFGRQWWQKRVWIRTAVVEWQHMLWWEFVDRWRFAPVVDRS